MKYVKGMGCVWGDGQVTSAPPPSYDPNLIVPPEVIKAVQTLREFAAKHDPSDNWQIGGLGPVFPLQRQLDAAHALNAALLADLARMQLTTTRGKR